MTIRQRIRDRLRPSFDFTIPDTPDVPHVAHYTHPDVRAALAAAAPDQPLLGLGAHGPVYAPRDHLLVTDGTGGGRSTVLRTIGAQALHHGHRVVILDMKGRSHRWAFRLDDVEYARTVDEVAATLTQLAAEMRDRDAMRDRDPDVQMRPVAVLVEEVAPILAALDHRHRDAGGEGRPEAVDAFRDLLSMGRGCQMWVAGTGHTLAAHALGPEGRDQFSHIIGARTTEATWRMLGARQPDPMPRHQGRYHLVQFGHVTPFQALYLTHADALVEAAQGPEEAY